VPNFVQKSILS